MLRNAPSYELFTILIIVSVIFIAIAKSLLPKRFNELVSVLGHSNYLKIYSREQKFFDKFDALLFVNFILSAAIFSFLCLHYKSKVLEPSIDELFKLTFAIGSFILIKVLLERLIGSLFEIDKLIDQYLFQKISYKNFLGLVLLPINALFIYSFKPPITVIYIIVVLLLLITVLGLISTIKTHLNVIKHNFFYFILYLCALEIAPYIILYKLFFSN